MNKKVIVLGASLKKARYSNHVVLLLQEKGFNVIAIGKRNGFIGKVKVSSAIEEVDGIHTITLYLNAKNQKEYYQFILDLKPKRVIFNPGAENVELEKLLVINKIPFENACTLVLLSTNQF